ncbi:hypothetical protein [Litorisediminicola beolgyonensis]|uniref:Uncharacterized protein n=1 Tax=Litorisediminicola beolgyonensis TaxID=1173614 RepID=A0ABW3ZHA6_9RHOB
MTCTKDGTHAPWCGRALTDGRLVGIRFDPPMAIARVGRAKEPVAAYRWEVDENPHRGMLTRIVPAPTLYLESAHGNGSWPHMLRVATPDTVTFKDRHKHVRPVAPFFELWAKMQDPDGSFWERPLTRALLEAHRASLRELLFTAEAGNRKAESRTKLASCAAVARRVFHADDYKPQKLDAVSPHTEGQVPMVTADAPLPLGQVQTFIANEDDPSCATRLDQIRLRFTPGKGESFGPPEATEAPSSPRAPGEFEPAVTEYGNIHRMTRPENRILDGEAGFLGFNFRTGNTPKWPTPMDSYDGSRVGSGNGWGLIDDTCDLVLEASLTVGGRQLRAHARAFAGPPDFAPDRRPMYSIADELRDREEGPTEPTLEDTPAEILDLFRRIFETSSLMNLDQRRHWALSGNPQLMGVENADDPDWDEGIAPRLGPRSMRESDTPYAEIVPDYTPGQGNTRAPVSGASDRLPYTQVVQQVHARMADSPVLREFLARRPDRVRQLVRPPFAKLSDLPRRVGVTPPAEVPVGKYAHEHDTTEADPPGTDRSSTGRPRYRDPRNVMDQVYDMRMPPYMRHSMGVPLSITRRQYDLLMAYLDKLETDPAWREAPRVLRDEEAPHDE